MRRWSGIPFFERENLQIRKSSEIVLSLNACLKNFPEIFAGLVFQRCGRVFNLSALTCFTLRRVIERHGLDLRMAARKVTALVKRTGCEQTGATGEFYSGRGRLRVHDAEQVFG